MPQARRGELWVIDLGMAQKPRPCLILSIVYLDHERAVVSYVPRTTALRSTRFEGETLAKFAVSVGTSLRRAVVLSKCSPATWRAVFREALLELPSILKHRRVKQQVLKFGFKFSVFP